MLIRLIKLYIEISNKQMVYSTVFVRYVQKQDGAVVFALSFQCAY